MRREATVLQTQTLILLHATDCKTSELHSQLTSHSRSPYYRPTEEKMKFFETKLYGAVVYYGADRSASKRLKIKSFHKFAVNQKDRYAICVH